MARLRLFTDGSVNPRSKVGYGAYLLVHREDSFLESKKADVKLKRFEGTSSTKLELQTLLWALSKIRGSGHEVVVFTDSQNIIGLRGRRTRLEQNDYQSKKNRYVKNYKLYQKFFEMVDGLACEFVKVKGHKVSRQKEDIDKFFTLVDKASRRALRHQEAGR